jgi:hypothetical protein
VASVGQQRQGFGDHAGQPGLEQADGDQRIDDRDAFCRHGQFGQISDGSANLNVCGGNGAALGAGGHCKNYLQGRVTQDTIQQLVRVKSDIPLFFGDLTTMEGESVAILFQHGFLPQTADPCHEDVRNGNGIADMYEVCANGNNRLTCYDTGNFNFTLYYNGCQWSDGITTWIISGKVSHYSYATDENENISMAEASWFSLTDTATNATMTLNGQAVRYQKINPLTGQPAMGTTGDEDGMFIVRMNVGVDMDGGGPAPNGNYYLFLVHDFEDGLAFLSGLCSVVWPFNPQDMNNIIFYDVNHHWNLTGLGCSVDIVDLNPANRTFRIVSQGVYGVNGCLADSGYLPY